MKGRRLRRAMVHVSVGASLALVMTLLLLSGGGDVSLAQLSPTCPVIDPITGLCDTVTSILPSTSTPTSTTTTTSTPTSTTTTTSTPTSTTTTTSTPASTTTGGTSTTSGTTGGTTGTTGTTSGGSGLLAGAAPFGSTAYGPGGLFSGAYTGNFGGGGTTYFAPTAQTLTSHQVYFQSAFGAPVSEDVATAAFDLSSIQAAPVASAATQVPRVMLLLVPVGFLILMLVTSLVLEVNEGGTGNAAIRSSRI
jgi:hypothetical protein